MDTKALFQIGYGLYVLTAADGLKDNGCIINTVAQITSDPIRLLVGVNKQNYTHDMIQKTGELNLSVLNQTAPFSLFQRFGFASGRNTNKFAEEKTITRAANGIAYLPEYTNAAMSCTVRQQIDMGTHSLFVVSMEQAQVFNQIPTMTYTYYQNEVKPKPVPKSGEKKQWVCRICGYVYEGEELPPDFICPICKHGAVDFELR